MGYDVLPYHHPISSISYHPSRLGQQLVQSTFRSREHRHVQPLSCAGSHGGATCHLGYPQRTDTICLVYPSMTIKWPFNSGFTHTHTICFASIWNPHHFSEYVNGLVCWGTSSPETIDFPIWLVVDLPLWKIFVSWDYHSQSMEK